MNYEQVMAGAQAWTRTEVGEDAEVSALGRLDGHAGLTFAFRVRDDTRSDRLVLRVAPPGVERRANNDVLRQVPLLGTLEGAGVPVPHVRSSGTEDGPFGTDYLIVEFMPGEVRATDGFTDAPPPEVAHYVDAARVLGLIHATAVTENLRDVLSERSVRAEIEAWDRALQRSEPDLTEALLGLRARLLDGAPPTARLGLIHGDYQFSNFLFDGDRLTAVLDWELAGVGPQLLDVGWLLAITDEANWEHPIPARPAGVAELVVAAYGAASGCAVDSGEVGYFEALACWRFAVIAGLNLSLHRSGRRIDDHWERIAPSVPRLIRRTNHLLGH